MRDAGVRDLGRRFASLLLVERQSAMYRIQGFVFTFPEQKYNSITCGNGLRVGVSLVAEFTVVAAVCYTVRMNFTRRT